MVDTELGLTRVFNGCIYNYQELRAELRATATASSRTSDTEVILKGYHHWGDRLRRAPARHVRLRDRRARHRPGACWPATGSASSRSTCTETPARSRFASTLPALLAGGGVDTRIDPVALHHYLTLPRRRARRRARSCAASRKLPPATVWSRSSPTAAAPTTTLLGPDFDAGAPEHATTGPTRDWEDAFSRRCALAVERRLVADVPVGVPAVRRPGLQPHRRAARRGGADTACRRSRSASRPSAARRATSSTTPTSSPSTSAPTTTRSASAPTGCCRRARRRHRRDERADGQPRRASPSTCSARRSPSTSRWCSPARAPTRSSPATTGTRRWPSRDPRTARSPSYARGVLRPRPRGGVAGAGQRRLRRRRRPEPGVRRRALRATGRRRPASTRRCGSTPGDAGRRPGQAGRQHDHGVGAGGPGAVPRPRARRAGRDLPARAEARRGRQGRAQGGRAGGSSRTRSSTGPRATSRCRRSPTSRARSSTWSATR